MPELIVELHGRRLGRLVGDWRTFDFVAEREAVERYGLDSVVLSVAVPLATRARRGDKARRQSFFAGLLPEGRMLDRLAREGGLATHDTIGLLRRYGRDVAGALQVWDPEEPGEPRQPRVEPLETAGVADLLRNVSAEPLGNKPTGGKTSLAGVQDKIVLARLGDSWARVLDGYPSTHILKPLQPSQPSLIHDEEFGARLARAIGVADFATWVEEFDGIVALVVERYDRTASDSKAVRVHQEDLAQALGVTGNAKYQRLGGTVSLRRIAAVLAEHADRASLDRLLAIITLAVAVGNLDLHAKNLSLIHAEDGSITLAPAYDVVPMAHQPTDGELALAVNGRYRHAAVTRDDLVAEARSWGLRGADTVVEATLDRLLRALRVEAPLPLAHSELKEDITRFVENLLAGRGAGEQV